jgi:DNA-binding IscR family transcriptional regulator
MGAGGGALLARPPERISLLDVYRAVEVEPLVAWHRCEPSQECPIGRSLREALEPEVDAAVEAFEARLARTSIADVARRIPVCDELNQLDQV